MIKIPIRFWIATMIFFTTYINYITRVNLSVSIIAMTKGKVKSEPECITLARKAKGGPEQTTIEGEIATKKPLPDYGPRYDWDEVIQGRLLGGYYIGYVIASLFGGPPSEWWGPHIVVFVMQILTAIFNVLSVPGTWLNPWVLYSTRWCIGFCAGFIYPALQSLIGTWSPPAEKGKFVAALMGNTLGIAITWPVVGSVTSSFGWDWGFYVLSIQIAVYCTAWWLIVADSPEKQKCISKEEMDYISTAQEGHVSHKKRKAPLIKILTCFPFWMLAILHSGNLWGLYLQLQGVPKFMSEVIGFNLKNSGFLSAVPHLTRLFLGIGFGFIGDYLKRNNVCRPVIIRKVFVILSHIIPGLLLIGISFCGCNWVPVLVLLTLSASINGAAVMTNLQNAQDLSPNFAGTIFGIISFLGGMTGFITPEVTALFIKSHNGIVEWGIVFTIGGIVLIGSGIIFMIFGSVQEQSWNNVED